MHENLSQKITTWDHEAQLRNKDVQKTELEQDFPALAEYLTKKGQSPGKTQSVRYGSSVKSWEKIILGGGKDNAHLIIGNDHGEKVTVEFLTNYLRRNFATTVEHAERLLAHLTGFHKAWSDFEKQKAALRPVAYGGYGKPINAAPVILFPNVWRGFDEKIQTIIDSVLQRPEIDLIMRLGSDRPGSALSPPSIEVSQCFERHHDADERPDEPAVVRAEQYIEFGLLLLKNSDRNEKFSTRLKQQVTQRASKTLPCMEVFWTHVDNGPLFVSGLSESIYKLVRKAETDIRDWMPTWKEKVGCVHGSR